MTVQFKEILEKARIKHNEALRLDEEYRVGEAAKALQDTKRAVEGFQSFLQGDFAKMYKTIHMNPREVEDGAYQLQKQLEDATKSLNAQIDALDEYISELHMYVNPQSPSNDTHRRDYSRWTR